MWELSVRPGSHRELPDFREFPLPSMKELLTSKADISHRLDHYVAFVARMCTILKKLGVEDKEIEEAKDMVAILW